MIRIDIVSGFLGAGKTTLIKKLLQEALEDTKVVLIENEFGEIGIDGGFLRDAGIEIKEMNSGCICCSLVGDFGTSLKEVISTYEPERILIEPSGVGKLSDVMTAVKDAINTSEVTLNSAVAVVDASKCKMYIKNFGEFFINQIANAGTIILSRTDKLSEEKLKKCIELIRKYNEKATIITTPWDQLQGKDILETMEGARDLQQAMMDELHEHTHQEHHNHGADCACKCNDHEHDHEGHHNHGTDCACECNDHDHNHEEHQSHGADCNCGCHDHEGHHHADEIFTSWGMETPALYNQDEIANILEKLEEEAEYGFVLRAKGIVPSENNKWIYFDYVPGESDIREGKADVTGKFCVIGSKLKENNLEKLFCK